MSGWISSENVFVAPTRKGETLPKLADLLKNELLVVLEEGESFSTRVSSVNSLLIMHAGMQMNLKSTTIPTDSTFK